MTTRYWHALTEGRVECDLCPRHCRMRPGQRGFCFVRQNVAGALVLTTYGRSSGFCIDPIEKKPLNHVAAGAGVLSFGTAGCNLACKFCQNWQISTATSFDALTDAASPEAIADAAARTGARGVAYTYNDPVIFPEYAIDVAGAARARGLLNIAVTAGYIEPEPRADFFAAMDAANVDLKSFREDFYRRVVGGRLGVVLDTLRYLVHETQVWVEVTTLVIPGFNDSDAELAQLAAFIAEQLGVDVPWHVTGFHPDNRMRDVPPTPVATLRRARRIGQQAGLRYVYTGNVVDAAGATTTCPGCGAPVVERAGYRIVGYDLDSSGRCRRCGAAVAGRWDAGPGGYGARRIPVRLG
jgi:pyruvate formate lyase activating enzyme